MEEVTQCQKESAYRLRIKFSIVSPFFLLLLRDSEWLLNRPVRSVFQVEAGAQCGQDIPMRRPHSASRATDLLKRILVRRREDNDKQSRFKQERFLGVIAACGEVIALYPDGRQRHHGECRESPLDDPEASTWELQLALTQMRAVD